MEYGTMEGNGPTHRLWTWTGEYKTMGFVGTIIGNGTTTLHLDLYMWLDMK